MTTNQRYFIYVWDSIRGWVKSHSQPNDGFEFEHEAIEQTILQSCKYPNVRYTVMSVIWTLS